ncbi:hypothetical protein [uncultured Jatrophihabitans sp.]|uniref:hypothetical protein n=1 Tax=uncultured Jatrophihabitans sp. TaxID=1610747 RepID=UPI0035CA629F
MTAPQTTTTSELKQGYEIPDDSTVEQPYSRVPANDVLATIGYTESGWPAVSSVVVPANTSRDPEYRRRIIEFLSELNRVMSTPSTIDTNLAAIDQVIGKRVTEYMLTLSVTSTMIPSIYPLSDRGALLRWTRGSDSLDVEFDTEGDVVALLKVDGRKSSGFLHSVWRDLTQWMFQTVAAAA